MSTGFTSHGFSCILLSMTDRRSGPPLFDLMRERGGHPDAPESSADPAPLLSQPKPLTPSVGAVDSGPVVSTKQTAWDSSGGVSRAERSAAAMLDTEVVADSGIRLSSPLFFTMIAITFALIIGAWTIGYQRGSAAGKAAIEPYVRDQPVVRPVQPQPAAEDPILIPAQTSTEQPNEPTTQPPAAMVATGSGIMSPSGFLETDPRGSGLNYLVLATLNTEQAADAIAFMYSNSVTIIGVPAVDSGSSGANNPSRYTLYSLGLAIPGNQWSAMSVERIQHQTLIANLGSRWQRERRGGSDFSLTNWAKYE